MSQEGVAERVFNKKNNNYLLGHHRQDLQLKNLQIISHIRSNIQT